MKTTFAWILSGILAVSLMIPASWAAPKRIEIKTTSRKIKEGAARAQIKNINLQNIEDQAARKAIQEILNYLNLTAKK